MGNGNDGKALQALLNAQLLTPHGEREPTEERLGQLKLAHS